MTIQIGIEISGSREWDEYVNSHPESTNYHRYAWKEVFESSFGHKGYYLSARDEAGSVRGVLPLVSMNSTLFGKFVISLPFVNYGGVLCDSVDIENMMIEEANKIRRTVNAKYVELRHHTRECAGLPTKCHKVSMILDLEKDEGAQWKAIDSKARNQVRKAEKSGLHVVSGHTELLDGFYSVFSRNMRDLGTPVYGVNFFRKVLGTFPETTRIISVMLNRDTVASGILTWFRDVLEVPWASSLREHRSLCANNLLYWEAIKFAIRNGAKKFDFGRSTPGEGTYQFKKQWGTTSLPLKWQYLLNESEQIPELNRLNPKYKSAIMAWKHLPVAVTKIIGPMIVKDIP